MINERGKSLLAPLEIKAALEKVTVAESCFDTERKYIGLSQIGDCPLITVRKYLNGHSAGVLGMLKCYKGYQMERDLVRRLTVAFPNRIQPGGEVSGFGGRVLGHPDFHLDDIPGDCKSVNLDEHLPKRGLPRRVEFQMNGYMYFGDKPRSYVVYESRQSGILRVYEVFPSSFIVTEIERRLGLIMLCISAKRMPVCECGRCVS